MISKEFTLGIIGGCFPVQARIGKEELYHQLIDTWIVSKSGIKLNKVIARYEHLYEFENVIMTLVQNNNLDVLLLHIRPDPYLRNSKFMIQYLDDSGKLKIHTNFPFRIKEPVFEIVPVNTLQNIQQKRRKNYLRKALREINYFAGIIFGINNEALNKMMKIILLTRNLCEKNNIKLILGGPPSRPRSQFENYLCRKLDRKIKRQNASILSPIKYISCIGEYSKDGEYLFFEDGVHLNPAGHKIIAEKLFKEILGIVTENEYAANEYS